MIFTLRGVRRGECGRTAILTLVHRRRSRIGDHRSSLLNRTQSCTRVLLTTLRNNSFLRPKAIVSILTRNVDYWHPLYSLCALRLVVRAGRGSWRVRSRSKTDQGVSSSNSSRLTPGCETPKAKRTYL